MNTKIQSMHLTYIGFCLKEMSMLIRNRTLISIKEAKKEKPAAQEQYHITGGIISEY